MTQFNNYPAPTLPLNGTEQTLIAQVSGNQTFTRTTSLSDLVGVPLTVYIVENLPLNVPVGTRAYVTDAVSPSFLGTLTGGGSVVCPAFFNGIAWIAA